jgi:ABC-type transport system involved in multi-copper enzyme maturation permease subunit
MAHRQDSTPLKSALASEGNESEILRMWLIARNEIIFNFRNYKIPSAIGTMTFIFLVSAQLLALDYKDRMNNWRINQINTREPTEGGRVRYESPGGVFFHLVGIGHDPPIRPPQPLSALVKGLDGEITRPVSLSQRIIFGVRQGQSATSAFFDIPDTSFIIKLLVSLFALFFSLDSLIREREAGTLRALLALSIRRRNVFFAKLVGVSLSLLFSFAVAYVCEILFLRYAHGLIIEQYGMRRALLIFCMGALYGLVFVNIGLFISASTRQARTAVASALLVWAAIVLAAPNAAGLLADLSSPTSSYNQFNAHLHEARRKALSEETQIGPPDRSLPGLQTSKLALRSVFELERRMTDEYLASKKRQLQRARTFAAFSPASALVFGLSDLADTGVSAYSSYLELLRSWRDIMLDAFMRRLDLPPQQGARLVQEASQRVDLEQRCAEPFRNGFGAAAIPIISLFAWAIFFGFAAFRRFERCDVR